MSGLKERVLKNADQIFSEETPSPRLRHMINVLAEQNEKLVRALGVAASDERERIYEDLGSPGLEGCGTVIVATKYDQTLQENASAISKLVEK